MASFVFVLLLPIMFFLHSLFQNSWRQMEQEMLEKHHLISEALVEPFTLFVTTRQQSLLTIGQELTQLSDDVAITLGYENKQERIQQILDKHLKSFGSFVALSYSPPPYSEVSCVSTTDTPRPEAIKPDYNGLTLLKLPKTPNGVAGQDQLSPVFTSTINNKPVVLVRHEILNQHSVVDGILYAEIALDQITSICSNIDFGDRGHCAVVDYTGKVVAHPRESWMESVKDLSKLPIVQAMLAGKSGTTEFYSPALETDMVAGYSAIPALGWGVMIPQPKAELTEMLSSFRLKTLIWLGFGVIVALLVSGYLTRKITSPINHLINRTKFPANRSDIVSLGEVPKGTPREIKKLWDSFSVLLADLQSSNREIKRLNVSLQEEIAIATAELRQANEELYKSSAQDYLTSLSNRRHFSEYLENILSNETDKMIGIILIDVDHFKQVNDQYGHETGDLALKHLATTLKESVRSTDLVARLGGDEFVVYVGNASDADLAKVADHIRQSIENNPLKTATGSLPLTLSIGTINQLNQGGLSLQRLLSQADQAMYRSKIAGRNQVSSHTLGSEIPGNEAQENLSEARSAADKTNA